MWKTWVQEPVRHMRARPAGGLAILITMTLLPLAAGLGGGVWHTVFGWEGPAQGRTVVWFFGMPMGPRPSYALDDVGLERLRPVFDGVSGFRFGQIVVQSEEETGRFAAAVAGREFFEVLGARVSDGFLAGWREGGVVLSARAARRLFRGRAAVGGDVRVHGQRAVVAAVLDEGQEYPRETDVWLPFGLADEAFVTEAVVLIGLGRVGPGSSIRQVERDLESVMGRRIAVEAIGDRYRREAGAVAGMTAAAAAAMAGVAMATMLLLVWARMERDAGADATRAMLGAGWRHLYGNHVARLALPLSIAAGLSLWLGGLSGRVVAASDAVTFDVLKRVDLSASWWALGVGALLVGVLAVSAYGAAAAATASRVRSRPRIAGVCLAAQIGLSILLVVTALGTFRSVRAFYAIPFGFEPEGAFLVYVSLPAGGFGAPESRSAAWQDLIDRVEALPGTAGAAVTTAAPFATERMSVLPLRVPAATRGDGVGAVVVRAVSPGYVRVLGARLVTGRALVETDDIGADVCLLQESVARQHFASVSDALGSEVVVGDTVLRVVGVVGDVAETTEVDPAMYVPMRSRPAYRATLVVRGTDSRGIERSAAAWARQLGLGVPRPLVERFETVVGRAVAAERTTGRVVGVLALIGLLIVVVSTHAMARQWLDARQREIGVRLALGASTWWLTRWLAGAFGLPLAAGTAAGVLVSTSTYQFAAHRLAGMTPVTAWDLATACACVAVSVSLANSHLVRNAFTRAPASLLRHAD